MKHGFLICLLAIALAAGGCSSKNDLLFENDHHLSDSVNKVKELTEGKQDWIGADVCIPEKDSSYTDSEISSGAAILYNLDKPEVIYSRKAYDHLNPSVLTVLLTAKIAIENTNMTDLVTVESEDLSGLVHAYKVGLKAGDQLTVEQLLYGMVFQSGAEPARVLARYVAGSEEAFVKMMNDKAQSLGCVDTIFSNCTGMTDKNNVTTAYDMYLLIRDMAADDQFMKILEKKNYEGYYQDSSGNPISATYISTVDYIEEGKEKVSGATILGGKTATTQASGHCLALIVKGEGNDRYLALNMKASSHERLYKQIESIVNKIGK